MWMKNSSNATLLVKAVATKDLANVRIWAETNTNDLRNASWKALPDIYNSPMAKGEMVAPVTVGLPGGRMGNIRFGGASSTNAPAAVLKAPAAVKPVAVKPTTVKPAAVKQAAPKARAEVRMLTRPWMTGYWVVLAATAIIWGVLKFSIWHDAQLEKAAIALDREVATVLAIAPDQGASWTPLFMNAYYEYLREGNLEDTTENFKKFKDLIKADKEVLDQIIRSFDPEEKEPPAIKELEGERIEWLKEQDAGAKAPDDMITRSELRGGLQSALMLATVAVILNAMPVRALEIKLGAPIRENDQISRVPVNVYNDETNSVLIRSMYVTATGDLVKQPMTNASVSLADNILLEPGDSLVAAPYATNATPTASMFGARADVERIQPAPEKVVTGMAPAAQSAVLDTAALNASVRQAQASLAATNVASRINVRMSDDGSKVEIRVSSNDPQFVLDVNSVLAVAAHEGDLYVRHLLNGATPQIVKIPNTLDLTILTPGTNTFPKSWVVTDENSIPQDIREAVLARAEVRAVDEAVLRDRLNAIRLDRKAVEDVVAMAKQRQDPVSIGENIAGKYGLNDTQRLTLVRQIILSQAARSEMRLRPSEKSDGIILLINEIEDGGSLRDYFRQANALDLEPAEYTLANGPKKFRQDMFWSLMNSLGNDVVASVGAESARGVAADFRKAGMQKEWFLRNFANIDRQGFLAAFDKIDKSVVADGFNQFARVLELSRVETGAEGQRPGLFAGPLLLRDYAVMLAAMTLAFPTMQVIATLAAFAFSRLPGAGVPSDMLNQIVTGYTVAGVVIAAAVGVWIVLQVTMGRVSLSAKLVPVLERILNKMGIGQVGNRRTTPWERFSLDPTRANFTALLTSWLPQALVEKLYKNNLSHDAFEGRVSGTPKEPWMPQALVEKLFRSNLSHDTFETPAPTRLPSQSEIAAQIRAMEAQVEAGIEQLSVPSGYDEVVATRLLSLLDQVENLTDSVAQPELRERTLAKVIAYGDTIIELMSKSRSETRGVTQKTPQTNAQILSMAVLRLTIAQGLLQKNPGFFEGKFSEFNKGITDSKEKLQPLSGEVSDAVVISQEITALDALINELVKIRPEIMAKVPQAYERHQAIQDVIYPLTLAVQGLRAWEDQNGISRPRSEVRWDEPMRDQLVAAANEEVYGAIRMASVELEKAPETYEVYGTRNGEDLSILENPRKGNSRTVRSDSVRNLIDAKAVGYKGGVFFFLPSLTAAVPTQPTSPVTPTAPVAVPPVSTKPVSPTVPVAGISGLTGIPDRTDIPYTANGNDKITLTRAEIKVGLEAQNPTIVRSGRSFNIPELSVRRSIAKYLESLVRNGEEAPIIVESGEQDVPTASQDVLLGILNRQITFSPVRANFVARAEVREDFTEQSRTDLIQNLEGYYGKGNVWITTGEVKDGRPQEIIIKVRVPQQGRVGPLEAENNLTMMGSRVIGPSYGYGIDFKYGMPVVRFDMAPDAYGFQDVSMRLVPRSEVRETSAERWARQNNVRVIPPTGLNVQAYAESLVSEYRQDRSRPAGGSWNGAWIIAAGDRMMQGDYRDAAKALVKDWEDRAQNKPVQPSSIGTMNDFAVKLLTEKQLRGPNVVVTGEYNGIPLSVSDVNDSVLAIVARYDTAFAARASMARDLRKDFPGVDKGVLDALVKERNVLGHILKDGILSVEAEIGKDGRLDLEPVITSGERARGILIRFEFYDFVNQGAKIMAAKQYLKALTESPDLAGYEIRRNPAEFNQDFTRRLVGGNAAVEVRIIPQARAEVRSTVEARQEFSRQVAEYLEKNEPVVFRTLNERLLKFGVGSVAEVVGMIIIPVEGAEKMAPAEVANALKTLVALKAGDFDAGLFIARAQDIMKNPVVALSDKLGAMVSASQGRTFEEIKAALQGEREQLFTNVGQYAWRAFSDDNLTSAQKAELEALARSIQNSSDHTGQQIGENRFRLVLVNTARLLNTARELERELSSKNKQFVGGNYVTVLLEDVDAKGAVFAGTVLKSEAGVKGNAIARSLVAKKASQYNLRISGKMATIPDALVKELPPNVFVSKDGYFEINDKALSALERVLSDLIAIQATSVSA
jgi:hypothetical protein